MTVRQRTVFCHGEFASTTAVNLVGAQTSIRESPYFDDRAAGRRMGFNMQPMEFDFSRLRKLSRRVGPPLRESQSEGFNCARKRTPRCSTNVFRCEGAVRAHLHSGA
jgi:hypothetical protein